MGRSSTVGEREQRTPTRPGAGGALVWSLVNTAVARFGTVAIGIALARMLGPEEFGTFAVALVALMAVLSFNELGVSLAIVRWRTDPAEIAPTVATISTATSVLVAGAAMLGAPAFAGAMGSPEAAGLVQLLVLCVVVNGVVATPAALMQRAFRQDQRMLVDQVNVWLGAAVSLAMAATGSGAEALVVGRLVGAVVSGALFLRFSPLPLRFGFDPRCARRLLSFGLPLAGASVVVFLVGFLDQVVVGSVLGPVTLGHYVLAVNLASWPVLLFSQPLRSVAPALFARMQHDPEALGRSFGLVLRPVALVALPLCAVMAVTAPELVRFVYGEAWAGAAPALRWLAVLAGLRIFFELAYDHLVVRERSRALLRVQLLWVTLLVPAVWWGTRSHGVEGAAVGLLVAAAAASVPLYLAELARVGVRPAAVLSALAVPLAAAAVTAAAAGALVATVAPDLVALVLCGLLSSAVSALLVLRHRADLDVFRKVSP
ncbi:oligosaccharide flippase family protein [Nocardioides solisilvae]|uniref:oligosaccharide flippase family protein n=1 Tax=Nocardioides solisilvae TaxID=1542435 RepID=UPI000D74EB3D|nr:oligosaccharide flippase family protein [Nocardioides solisilvae]